jgi:hypothetical protein
MKNITPKTQKGKMPENKMPVLVSLDDAGQMLSVSPRTIRRLSQSGLLPDIIKLGHSARISYQGILDYISRLNIAGLSL